MMFLLACTLCAQQPAASNAAPANAKSPIIAAGEIANGVYRNSWFGFSCRIPYGYVDRTDTMQESSDDPKKALVLLSVFERPPEARGSDVNSGIVIAAEATSAYPGIKSPAQYFGPLGEVATAQGLTKVNDPYEFPVDGKPIVREDFIKTIAGVGFHQSTLAWMAQGYVVSFTFIGSSDEEVQSLIEGLKFSYSHKSKTQTSKP
jgi:hypothetical protein